MKIAKGYTRVSTNMQKEDGISLDTQATKIKEYCNYKKLDLVKIYQDAGLSAKDMTNRPSLLELLRGIQEGDHIIFSDLSRLSRDTRDILTINQIIKAKKAILVCLEPDIDFSTPAGEMMMSVLTSLHKYERDITAQKVSDNMKYLAAEGKLRSRAPFGWKFVGKDKDFEPVPEQQQVIKFCITAHNSGMGREQIATTLNTNGYAYIFNLNKKKPCKNPQFHGHTIKTILMDAGVIEDDKRRPIENRIISYHKIEVTV